MGAQKEEVVLERRRQIHLGALSKSLTNRDGSIKGLWANLGQFAKMCCHVSTWQ